MQDAHGQRPADLTVELLQNPRSFAFSQAVRVLTASRRAALDEAASLRLRYRSSLSLAYPVGDIESLCVISDGMPVNGMEAQAKALLQPSTEVEVTQSFMGLSGAFGTLSYRYTERVLECEHVSMPNAPRSFFDVLIQKPVAQFHASWRYQHPALGYEVPGLNAFGHALRCLVGDGLRNDAGQHAPDIGSPEAFVKPLIAALRQRTLSTRYLSRILSEVSGAPVRVEDHVEAWYPMDEALRTRLGKANCLLGVNVILGSATRQRQLRLRLHVGPLRLAQYYDFLADGKAACVLRAWLARMLGHSCEYEVVPILHRDDVTPIQLGGPGLHSLGRDTFLVLRPSAVNRRDFSYLLQI